MRPPLAARFGFSLTLVMGGLGLACGRMPFSVPVTGSADAATNTDGASPADTTGGLTGDADTSAAAACSSGTAECVTEQMARVCMTDGTWGTPFTCDSGCSDGICHECTAGQQMCLSSQKLEVCQTTGFWSAPTQCPGGCANAACVGSPIDAGAADVATCVPGTARCLDDTISYCSNDGTWGLGQFCSFRGCTNDHCWECTPGKTTCLSSVQLGVCQADGTYAPQGTCPSGCDPDAGACEASGSDQ